MMTTVTVPSKKMPVKKRAFADALDTRLFCSSTHNPPTKRARTWNVTDDSPQVLPPCPLEKTKVTIDRKIATPTEIASRIAETLRTLSADVAFDSNKATATVVTEEGVAMQISLFKVEKSSGDETIVEVQRRQGCGASFSRCARLILNAAQGFTTSAPNFNEKSKFTIPSSILRKDIIFEQKQQEEGGKSSLLALQLIDSLLKRDHFDANKLGLESLCSLTEPSQASTSTAALVGQIVLCGDLVVHHWDVPAFTLACSEEERSIGSTICDAVLGLVLKDALDSSYRTIAQTNTLRRLGLVAFSNALDAVVKSQRTQEILTRMQQLCPPELISVLVELLEGANTCACDAYLAAKVLGYFLLVSTDVLECSRELGALSAIKMALVVGHERHRKLEGEAEKLLRLLE